jgi:hypothetical protein
MDKKKTVKITMPLPDYEEMIVYAQARGLDIRNFLRYSAKQQMNRYPLSDAQKGRAGEIIQKDKKRRQAVQPDTMGGD